MSSENFLEVIGAVKSDLDKQIRNKDKNLSEIVKSLEITASLESVFSEQERDTLKFLKEILSDLNLETSLDDIDSLLDDIDLGDVDSLLDELDDIDLDQNDNVKKKGKGRKFDTSWLNDLNIPQGDKINLKTWFEGSVDEIIVGDKSYITSNDVVENEVRLNLKNSSGSELLFFGGVFPTTGIYKKTTIRKSKGRKESLSTKFYDNKKAFDFALKKTLIENFKNK